MRFTQTRHFTKRITAIASMLALWVLSPHLTANAQVLVVEPSCGVAGSSVLVTGSGWAEPAPVCDYHFFFDGAVFAPTQPDGLFGPPDTTTTIPAAATLGLHEVQVELRLTSDLKLLQCRKTNFNVVTVENKDPWDGGNNVNLSKWTSANSSDTRIDIDFDPADVCEPQDTTNVSSCSKIAFIQARRLSGLNAAGDFVRFMTYQEQNNCWSAAEARDKETVGYDSTTKLIDSAVSGAGWKIDISRTSPDPYYQSRSLGDFGFTQQFDETPSDRESDMADAPTRSDICYPTDIDTMKYVFRANAFCAEGLDRGRYFGGVTWTWERKKGRKRPNGTTPEVQGTITKSAPDRSSPSADFLAALSLWTSANSKTIPMPGPPTTPTGVICTAFFGG